MVLANLIAELKPIDETFTTMGWINLLVKHINMAEKNDVIRIVGGELCCRIYDDSDVLDAFVDAHKKGIKTQIIAGPILSVWMKEESSRSKAKVVHENRMIELVKKRIVELYYRERRAEIHYRIVGNEKSKVVHIEAFHNPLAPAPNRQKLQIPDQREEEIYNSAKTDFDSFITSKEVIFSSDPKKEFLILSIDQIEQLNEKTQKSRININSLTRSQIEKIL